MWRKCILILWCKGLTSPLSLILFPCFSWHFLLWYTFNFLCPISIFISTFMFSSSLPTCVFSAVIITLGNLGVRKLKLRYAERKIWDFPHTVIFVIIYVCNNLDKIDRVVNVFFDCLEISRNDELKWIRVFSCTAEPWPKSETAGESSV